MELIAILEKRLSAKLFAHIRGGSFDREINHIWGAHPTSHGNEEIN